MMVVERQRERSRRRVGERVKEERKRRKERNERREQQGKKLKLWKGESSGWSSSRSVRKFKLPVRPGHACSKTICPYWSCTVGHTSGTLGSKKQMTGIYFNEPSSALCFNHSLFNLQRTSALLSDYTCQENKILPARYDYPKGEKLHDLRNIIFVGF